MRVLAAAACGLLLAACGTETADPPVERVPGGADAPDATASTAPAPVPGSDPGENDAEHDEARASNRTDGAPVAWTLTQLPEGMRPVVVTDDSARRSVHYQRLAASGDPFDAPIVITSTTDDQSYLELAHGSRSVSVGDVDGVGYELHDDGERFGSAVTWPDGDSWVTVSWSEIVPIDDVVDVARSARPVDDTEWSRLVRTLGSETVIGGDVADTVEEVVAELAGASGSGYTLVGLVPADYPIDDNDARLACVRLDVDGVPGEVRCDSHPWWLRNGDDTLVFGKARPDVDQVVVQRIDTSERPTDDPPVVATPVVASRPSPVAFYLVEIPGWCWVTLTAGDGADDANLDSIGPFPDDPDHAACLAEETS